MGGKVKTYRIEETGIGLDGNDLEKKGSPITIQNITIEDGKSKLRWKFFTCSILFFLAVLVSLLLLTSTKITKSHYKTSRTTVYEIRNENEYPTEFIASIHESPYNGVIEETTVKNNDDDTSNDRLESDLINEVAVTNQSLTSNDTNDGPVDLEIKEDAWDTTVANNGVVEESTKEEDSSRNIPNNIESEIGKEVTTEEEHTEPAGRSSKIISTEQEVTESDTLSVNIGFPSMENSEVLLGLGVVSIGAGAAIIASTL